MNDGIGIATRRDVQIQNVRVERVYDNIKGGHADCVQIQQGVGQLRVDRFTCTTERQGIFLGDHDGPIGSVDLRASISTARPGQHLFWQTSPTLSRRARGRAARHRGDFKAWAPFGYWVYPQRDGRTYTGVVQQSAGTRSCRETVSACGSWARGSAA